MSVQAAPAVPGTADAEPVSMAAAHEWIARGCLTAGPAGRIGTELELQVADPRGWAVPVDPGRLAEFAPALAATMRHSLVTREPGGQVELSLLPQPGLARALSAASEDLAAARQAADAAGLRLAGVGLHPVRHPARVLDAPRYVAMEAYLDRGGPAGRVMMTLTASVQVNVEAAAAGCRSRAGGRWWLLHLVGPALVAAFANSPLRGGRPTGWKSTRQATWQAIDRARTAPVAAGPDEEPGEAFARYALAAPVMMVRRADGQWPVPGGLTFAGWIGGHGASAGLAPPTVGDLAYHLTTLFPPVRPRGFLEVRYLDAQPGRWWRAAAAAVWSLAEDGRAADEAASAAEPVAGRWRDAARLGPADPPLRQGAIGCLAAARDGLSRLGEPGLAAELDAFAGRFAERGRCPADDLLDRREALAHSSAVTESEVLP